MTFTEKQISEATIMIHSLLTFYKLQDLLPCYKKFGHALARPAVVGEIVKTTISGRDETGDRIAKENEWLVTCSSSHGEKMLIADSVFKKRYVFGMSVADGAVYLPVGYFYGVRYIGPDIVIRPPSWGKSVENITNGYMIGTTHLDNLDTDFYGIDPIAFEKTYQLA